MYHIIQYNGLQAEGSGDEEKMEGVESESIMTHISVPSQQEVSWYNYTCKYKPY